MKISEIEYIKFFRKSQSSSRQDATDSGAIRTLELPEESNSSLLDKLEVLSMTANCFEHNGIDDLEFSIHTKNAIVRGSLTYSDIWDTVNEF